MFDGFIAHETLASVAWTLFTSLPWFLLATTLFWITYTRYLHSLARVPGPFIASITRLWYVRNVQEGSFDTINRQLHETYGTVTTIFEIRMGSDY